MATVESWFLDFVERHQSRHPRADWPQDQIFWLAFRSILVKHGVTEAVADEASVSMMEQPAPFPDQFTAAFLAAVKAVWASSQVFDAGLSDKDAAHAAMRVMFGGAECDDCHGQGFAIRYRRRSLGQSDSKGRPVPPAVQFYCLCPVGRWVERSHREGSEEARVVRKRIPDLADYPAMRGDEFRSPPSSGVKLGVAAGAA